MNVTLVRSKNTIAYWALPIALSIIIGLSSQTRIFLPFTPIPITLQLHMILLFSYLLGDTRALLMSSCFLLQGCFGLSVFASGGGMASFFGPTGGYLVGYLVASLVVAKLNNKSAFIVMGIGNLIIYLFGWLHLSQFLGFVDAGLLGILPFICFDLCKLAVCGFCVDMLRQRCWEA